jgi:integrase
MPACRALSNRPVLTGEAMAVRKLTSAFVKTARAEPEAERTVYWDEALPSFGLMITSNGHRSYVAQYRANGKSRRYTIGSAAALNLDVARKRAKAILGQVAHGKDPAVEKRRAAESSRNSFKAVSERYFQREGGKLRTTEQRRATLERLVFPRLGAKQIDDISRPEIVQLLDGIEDERGPAMANQVLAIVRKIFNWHALRSDTFRTPIVPGMARQQQGDRTRVLSDEELQRVWTTVESYPGPWSQFVRFLLLTAARRTEVAGMRWSEISDGLWSIPPERYKTNAEVTLPLSTAATSVLTELPRFANSDFVFTVNGRAPIAGFSAFKLKFDFSCGVRDWTIHDLRRTARSLLSRAGVNADIAERCLGHVIGGVRGTYDRHRYLEEMRHAFEALATLIDHIVHPQENVIAIRDSAG